MILWQDMYIK